MTEPRTVEFFGETFTLNSEVSEYALLEFAEAASDGQDGDTVEGLASMSRLVTECISEGDRARFKASARKNRAKADDLTKIIEATFSARTERPTVRPSDSSDGPSDTALKSASNSEDKPSRLDGRPDLRMMLREDAKQSA